MLPPLLWLVFLFDSPSEEDALADGADDDSDADADDLTVVDFVPRTGDLTVVGGAPLQVPPTPSPLVATLFCCFLLRNLVASAPI